jgi:hypothetical protein
MVRQRDNYIWSSVSFAYIAYTLVPEVYFHCVRNGESKINLCLKAAIASLSWNEIQLTMDQSEHTWHVISSELNQSENFFVYLSNQETESESDSSAASNLGYLSSRKTISSLSESSVPIQLYSFHWSNLVPRLQAVEERAYARGCNRSQ